MEREIKLWSGTKMYESDLKAIFTLDTIFKYASEDELRAIVSSIIGRLWIDLIDDRLESPTDKDIAKIAKELRDVK